MNSPIIANWSLTYKCNLSCAHCYSRPYLNKAAELSETDALIVARLIKSSGLSAVNFGGGECLLRKDFWTLVSEIKSGGKTEVLYTSNGYTISPNVASRMKEAGISAVVLSLEGLEEVHNKNRGRNDAFAHVLSAHDELRHNKIRVNINFTIINESAELAYEILDYINKRLDVCRVNISIAKQTPDLIDARSSTVDKEATFSQILLYAEHHETPPIFVNDSSFESLVPEHLKPRFLSFKERCSCGTTSFSILPDGEIISCPFSNISLGSALKCENFRNILLTASRYHPPISCTNLRIPVISI